MGHSSRTRRACQVGQGFPAATRFPLGRLALQHFGFEGSAFSRPCPVPSCLAEPWHWCVSKSGRRMTGRTHVQRSGPPLRAPQPAGNAVAGGE